MSKENSFINFAIGTKLYVPDAVQVWRRGEIIETKGESVLLRMDSDEKTEENVYELKNNELFHLCNTDVWSSNGLYIPEDLTQLTHLHEASVLDSLNLRFDVDCIYTFTGPILIAVNPFKNIPGLYDTEKLIEYMKSVSYSSSIMCLPTSSYLSFDSNSFHASSSSNFASSCNVAPHVFATSNSAYLGLCNTHKSQTILISGESGAGKTESTKYVMKFLACVGAEDINNRSQVEKQALESNPLLEAFGNARTIRNDNSSRFGKFIEMQFELKINSSAKNSRSVKNKGSVDDLKNYANDNSTYHSNSNMSHVGRLCGARIQTYLLEKVRVCDQQEGERNYHIFYQVCAAAAAALRNSENPGIYNFPLTERFQKERNDIGEQQMDLRLFEPYFNYRYLTKSSCYELNRFDDVHEFESTIYAMQTVGISLKEQMDIIRVVGGILCLGNILFETPSCNSEGSEISKLCNEYFNKTVELLGFTDKEKLKNVLCYRTIKTAHESYKKPLKVSEAEDSRDALARALYGCMFLKVVQRTNQSIGYREDVKLFCGVLDIFGFECFKHNSFEQLCINYTNERLQQFFNNFVFKCEEALYFREKIPWNPLDFPDNQDCVNLLQDKPFGVFAMLDEECQVPAGKDRGFNSKICQKHSGHKRFKMLKTKPNCFIILHFAGSVEYCSDGFLDKNKDQLSNDIQNIVLESSNSFVANLFSDFLNRDSVEIAAPTASSSESSKKSALYCDNTASNSHSLNSSLSTCSSLSTIPKKRKYLTVSSEFREQLSLLINTINVTEPHFVRCIKPNPQNCPDIFERTTVNEQLRYGGVLQAVQVSRAGYPVRLSHKECFDDYFCIVERKTKEEVEFYKKLFSENDEKNLSDKAKVKLLLDFLDEKLKIPKPKYSSFSWSVGETLCFFKNEAFEILQVNRNRVRTSAAIKIQSAYRGFTQRRMFLFVKRTVIYIQSHIRVFLAKKLALRLRKRKAARIILNYLKMYKCRKEYLRTLKKIITIQKFFRGYKARKYAKQYKLTVCAAKIQAHWRRYKQRKYYLRLKSATIKAQLCWKRIIARRQLRTLRAEAREVSNLITKSQNLMRELNAEKQKNNEIECHLFQMNAKYDELLKKYENVCKDFELNKKHTREELNFANSRYEGLTRALSLHSRVNEISNFAKQHSSEQNSIPASASHSKEKSELIDIAKIVNEARKDDLENIDTMKKEIEGLQSKINLLQEDLVQERRLRQETEAKYNLILDDASHKLVSPQSIGFQKENENEKKKKKTKQFRWIHVLLTGPSGSGKTSLLEGFIKHMADEIHLEEMKKIRALERAGTYSLRHFEISYGDFVLHLVDCPYIKDSSIIEDTVVHMKQAQHIIVVFDPSSNESFDEALNILKKASVQAIPNSPLSVIFLANTYKIHAAQAVLQTDLKRARDAAATLRAVYREKCLLVDLITELFGEPLQGKTLKRSEIIIPSSILNSQSCRRHNNSAMTQSGVFSGFPPSAVASPLSSTGISFSTYSQRWGLSSVVDTMKTWFNASQSKKHIVSLQLLRPSIKGMQPHAQSYSKLSQSAPDDYAEIKPVQELQDIDSAVTYIAFGQEKTRNTFVLLAAAYKDGHVVIYRCYRTDMEMQIINEEANNYYNFNNNNFASNHSNNVSLEADRANIHEEQYREHPNIVVHSRLLGHSKAVTSMFFTILEDQMVTTSIDKSVRFWSVETGEMLKVFTDSSPTLVAAFLPFNPTVFIASNSNAVLRLVNIENGAVVQKLKVNSEVRTLRFDDTGLFCFAGTRRGEVHVLETSEASNVRFKFKTQIAKAAITCITFVASNSPDTSPFLLINACDSTLTIVDCTYGDKKGGLSNLHTRVRLAITHSLLPLRCCYSHHGGGWAISASEDREIHVFSLAKRSSYKLTTLKYHLFPILAVAVTSLDTLLVSADSSGKIVLWRRFDYSHCHPTNSNFSAHPNNSSTVLTQPNSM